ncbi:MAG TPA: D-alanyl-D-alanine carboxypeptidase family protein [Stenotrophobium sp.]|nr:D-alanyl-D-alanine carboxypeptidase family protein [Stenotrophobium sp.]
MKKLLLLSLLAVFSVSANAMPVPTAPTLDAHSYVLMDYQSGEIIASMNPDERVQPASITKLLTIYIAFDQIKKGQLKLTDTALVSKKAWMQGIDSSESRMFLEVGTRVTISDLLRGIIIDSGNDAAVALAEDIAGSEDLFAQMMNQYAKKLGMDHSHFADASGMPNPEHYVTARDVATLTRALIQNFPQLYKIFSEKDFKYGKVATQHNRNGLLWKDPTVDGLKTGHTQAAGYCLVASALRDGRRLISVVMGAQSWANRESYSLELLNYGFRFFETDQMFGPQQPVSTVRVWKGAEEQLPVGVTPAVVMALPQGSRSQLKYTTQVTTVPVAPIAMGQKLGTVSITLDGKVIRTEPLVALKAIPQGSLWQRLSDSVQMMISR